MTEQNQNNKQPSSRRSRGPRGNNRGGRKNYASEGDALGPVSTPATPTIRCNGTQTKKNSRKSRPNNISVSPGSVEPSQRTPPTSEPIPIGGLASASSTSRFASSSSFHSPAPNTLPRPAFTIFSKSETFASTREGTSIRVRSESVNVQQPERSSPSAWLQTHTDETSESSWQTHETDAISIQTYETHASSLPPEPDAETEHTEWHTTAGTRGPKQVDGIPRANSANAAVPFSAPERSHPVLFNDSAIPIALPQHPPPRGVSDNTGTLSSAMKPNDFMSPFSSPLRGTQYFSSQLSHPQAAQSYFPPQHAQAQAHRPHQQHFTAQPVQNQAAQLRMAHYSQSEQSPSAQHRVGHYSQSEQSPAPQPHPVYLSPQQAQAQAANLPLWEASPQHTPANVAHHHVATPPQLDPSDEVKRLLWGASTPSPQVPSASAAVRSSHSTMPAQAFPRDPPLRTATSRDSMCYPQLRGGFSAPPTAGGSKSNSGGLGTRESIAEDAIRKVLGLNFPLSMSRGLDGNGSPQGRFSGHA